ncbi:MAG: hypothetical protein DI533_00320 [Cereibacter sphaeroides]|uniref:Holliday junction nuclease RuvC n=1 Tax=Cereibacter sphaeroides TaxID=1063 RepID=A0A2W5TTB1_CERSP|nr:MAG: hypothetical protein DI533_00320 [Cereibacter sphaeroides]
MKVLSFDTATVTGCAFGVAGDKPRSWSVDLGKADWSIRFSQTLRMTATYIKDYGPDLIAVEEFVGGPKANTNLAGLVACVKGEANRRGVRVVSYWPATIRAHFLGRGSKSKIPIKAQVFARCKMLGWEPGDTDASDALALWDYACSMESRAHQMTSVGGLFGGQK